MTYLGAHLSSSGGFHKMGKAALAIGANTPGGPGPRLLTRRTWDGCGS